MSKSMWSKILFNPVKVYGIRIRTHPLFLLSMTHRYRLGHWIFGLSHVKQYSSVFQLSDNILYVFYQ